MNLTGWHLRADGAIELRMDRPYKWKRKPTLVFYGAGRNCKYRISANDGDVLTFAGERRT